MRVTAWMPAALALSLAACASAPSGAGSLRLTGRALVAVPQAGYGVFLSWRLLEQDGPGTAFEVWRGPAGRDAFAKVGEAKDTTTFRDAPGPGEFSYAVVPDGGVLKGVRSNVATVRTAPQGRDWVEVLPAAKGRPLQFSDRHFADTDGDGELEFVTYSPQVISYRGGTSSESFKLQVFELLDGAPPRWTFDTGMGLQDKPGSGDHRADWDYEWTFKPVAWDLDGDFRAEIVTLAKIEGKYQYVVLKDEGDRARIVARLDSPVPVANGANNSRHFPFFAHLGGGKPSFLLQGGTYGWWAIWAYDYEPGGFRLRWHVDSKAPDFKGNRSSSHTVLAIDTDGDGRDEIFNGLTMLDADGKVRWSGNAEFGANVHVDGTVVDDIDPANPGLEILVFAEQGAKIGLYDLKSGRSLWVREAPGKHIQISVAAKLEEGPGLTIAGAYGGHKGPGVFAMRHDGSLLPYPLPERPRNGDRLWVMDWEGTHGRNACLNFTKVFGIGPKPLFEATFGDAPEGAVIPWGEHDLHFFWCNVDAVGDYREEILVQMKDGSVRAYLNTKTPPARRRCKWQNRNYQTLQAAGDYRYFIVPLGE
jgi:hypothetical protein